MARQTFGNTWWGTQWLYALREIDWENRLPRGRRYANNGSVDELAIDGTNVRARVKGSRPRPYKVTLRIPAMTVADTKELVDTLATDPALIGRLLNRELDPAVLERADSLRITVFPTRWRDLHMHCSCPDWAVPCKHLAAVIYILSREIDGDPFLVFRLRGVDLAAELERRGLTITAEATGAPPGLDELALAGADDNEREPAPEPDALAHIDYSGLPDLVDALPKALPPNPPFSPAGDFRKRWTTCMGRFAKAARRQLEHGEAAQEHPTARLTPDDTPRLLVDANADAAVIGAEDVTELAELLPFLGALETADLADYQPEVAGLHAANRAALHFLQAGAAVPWIFALQRSGTGLLWLPATLDPSVRALIEQLARGLPSNLLRLQVGRRQRRLSPRMQARLLCGLFMDHWMREWGADLPDAQRGDKVMALFFGDGCEWFDGPGEEAVPGSIRTWIARLHLAESDHAPALRLEEDDDAFTLSIDVTARNDAAARAPTPLAQLLQDPQWATQRSRILQTISMLADSYPPIDDYVRAGADAPMRIAADRLPELLFEVLPIVQLLGIRTLLPRALEQLLKPQRSLEVTSRETGGFLSADDLFSFNWRVAVGDHLLTPEEFESLVSHATGVVRFRGEYAYLEPQEVERLRKQLDKPARLHGAELTRIALTGEYEGAPVHLDEAAHERVKALKTISEVPLPTAIEAELRPYQQRGFRWLYGNTRAGLGSVIADDMGLGKTVQVLATVLKLKEDGEIGSHTSALIVVPTSLLTNWRKEIERFTPSLSIHVYHGPGRTLPAAGGQPDLVVTTYGHARSDLAALRGLSWRVVVVDEAQNIKNPSAAQTKAIKSIRAGAHIAMSGTPVENRLSEYWSIMDFANPGYLGTPKRFSEQFATPIEVHGDQRIAEQFRRAAAPFLMRRVKTDTSIISDLPEKIEQDQFCELTDAQAAVYESVVREGLEVIQGASDTFQRQGLVLQMILALKQICNHPRQYLNDGAATPAHSGKAQRLLELLTETHRLHEKVLVFTQFRKAGELLQGWIAEAFGRTPAFLHGGLSRKHRDAMVERFQSDRTERVFILSLKAAGTGLNLTAASQVIHFDLWWNPAVEAQATDRAYRIGQSQTVQVHRLITRETFEERINDMIRSKRALSELTVGTGEQWIGNLRDEELRNVFALGR